MKNLYAYRKNEVPGNGVDLFRSTDNNLIPIIDTARLFENVNILEETVCNNNEAT